MASGELFAFIDESGQRSKSERSSDHFVMSAAIVPASHLPDLSAFLATLRAELNRRPNDHLTWKNLRTHGERLHAARSIGSQNWIRTCSVVVCKRYLSASILNDDHAYLYTVRFLLERLSWLARQNSAVLTYTLAAIQRFPKSKLREYESALRGRPDCNIDWENLNPNGGQINQPQRYEPLQLGDLVASATAQAFEPDRFGNVEPRYLTEMAPVIWGGPYRRKPTSYGLKMPPWNDTTKAAYPWVATL